MLKSVLWVFVSKLFDVYHFQSPFGDTVESSKAPEVISKAVASLPPEQMFELMKQMKVIMLWWKLYENIFVSNILGSFRVF